jgi:hypothetical protein
MPKSSEGSKVKDKRTLSAVTNPTTCPEEKIVWEPAQNGAGTAIFKKDEEATFALEELRECQGFDLERMAADGDAIRVEKRYVLTRQGLDKLISEAEQQGKEEVAKVLKSKKSRYWFRGAHES